MNRFRKIALAVENFQSYTGPSPNLAKILDFFKEHGFDYREDTTGCFRDGQSKVCKVYTAKGSMSQFLISTDGNLLPRFCIILWRCSDDDLMFQISETDECNKHVKDHLLGKHFETEDDFKAYFTHIKKVMK